MTRFELINKYHYESIGRVKKDDILRDNITETIELFLEDVEAESGSELYDTIEIFYKTISEWYGAWYSYQLEVTNYQNIQILNEYVTSNIIQNVVLLLKNGKSFTDGFSAFFYQRGSTLLSLMACHRVDIAQRLYPQLIKGLQLVTPDMWEERRIKPQKLSVLAIEMLASEHNQTIDWGSMGIPIERFYKDFVDEALYTEDETLLSQWLVALCDQHLKWADTSKINPDESVLFGYEIRQEHQYLWPFEYQAVKNFRATKGLSTPMIDHPLLKTPMAIDHRPDLSQWKQPDWFDDVLTKLVALNPELAVIPDLLKELA